MMVQMKDEMVEGNGAWVGMNKKDMTRRGFLVFVHGRLENTGQALVYLEWFDMKSPDAVTHVMTHVSEPKAKCVSHTDTIRLA